MAMQTGTRDKVAAALAWQVENGHLTEEDAALIEGYIRKKILERGVDESTATNRARYLAIFMKDLGKPVRKCSTQDVCTVLAAMRSKYRPNTFNQMVYLIKDFLAPLKIRGIDMEEIRRIKPGKQRETTKTAAQMLTGEEILALFEEATNSRDRAILQLLYESGMRPVELVRLTWDEVKFDEYGAVINTSEKTGKPRYIRLITSAPALAAWKQDYPLAITPGAGSRVFLKLRRGRTGHIPITTTAIRHLVIKVAAKAGLEKKIFPYLFRHTRISHMLEEEIPESVIKMQGWGSLSTPMLATYGHISNGHIDRVLLERAGVITPKARKPRTPKPRQCPGCNTVNGPTANYCGVCGRPLTEEVKERQQSISSRLKALIREDPEGFARAIEQLE
jgi:integrase/recombinase XerD